MKKFLLLFFVITGFTTFAQSVNEAIEAFNAGELLRQEKKYDQAIANYEKAYEIATSTEDDATEVLEKIGKIIPTTYLVKAQDLYRAKNFKEALTTLDKAVETSDKFDQADTKKKALASKPTLLYQLGASELEAGDVDAAIDHFNKAITDNPSFDLGYLGLGNAYAKQDNFELTLQNYDKCLALPNIKAQVKTMCSKSAFSYIFEKGNDAYSKNEFDKALTLLEQALTYDKTNADVIYLAVVSAGKISKFDKAVSLSIEALEIEKRESEKGKIQFELANGYKALKQNDNACKTFKLLQSSTTYKSRADFELKQLKCN